MTMKFRLLKPSELTEEEQKQVGNRDMNVGVLHGALTAEDIAAITGFAGSYLFRGRVYLGRIDTTGSGQSAADEIVAALNTYGLVTTN